MLPAHINLNMAIKHCLCGTVAVYPCGPICHWHIEEIMGHVGSGQKIISTFFVAKAMEQILDESWEAVNDEVGARVGDAIGAAYSGVLQSFFRRIPVNELFAE